MEALPDLRLIVLPLPDYFRNLFSGLPWGHPPILGARGPWDYFHVSPFFKFFPNSAPPGFPFNFSRSGIVSATAIRSRRMADLQRFRPGPIDDPLKLRVSLRE